jgi:hypothetical protein
VDFTMLLLMEIRCSLYHIFHDYLANFLLAGYVATRLLR